MAAKVIRLSGVVVSGHEREGPYRVERAGIREASSVVRLLSGCSLVVGGWVPGSVGWRGLPKIWVHPTYPPALS